ncbi:alpha/beta hydrolase [Streptomyces albus]|nr:alpha/beta hydrolase [Streptomyces albus]
MTATVSFRIDTPAGHREVSAVHERHGSGEPVVLLHGIGHHLQAWEPVTGILAAERDIVAVDLPGFGASPPCRTASPTTCRPSPGPWASSARRWGWTARTWWATPWAACSPWNSAARDWRARSRPSRRPDSGARANAGTPSARCARCGRRPWRCRSRWSSGRPAPPPGAPPSPAPSTPARVAARRRRWSPRRWRCAECTRLRTDPGVSRDALFTHDVPDVPVTVAWGSRDRILLRRQGVRAKQVIPKARLIRLPGCGHVPMNDDPALVARVILDATR